MDMVSSETDLEKEVKVTLTIDIITKAAAVKKLEEETPDITTDDSLLQKNSS